MQKTKNSKSSWLVCIYIFLVVIFIYSHLSISGIVLGVNSKAESLKAMQEEIEYREKTTEGDILDCNGGYIYHNEINYYPTAYSYLVGFNSLQYGEYGLRGNYKEYLLYNTHDNKGSTITLTTDNYLQEFAYGLLKEKGSIIVLENTTGAIKCLASFNGMDFNVDHLDKMEEYNQYNGFFIPTATKDMDPPGSTFKIVTSASAIENNKGDFTVTDNGYWTLPTGNKIFNFGGYQNGYIEMKQALKASSNVYYSQLGLALGKQKLEATASDFLIGKTIELDFTTIKSSYGENNNLDTLANMAYGQGQLQMSPMNLAMIVNSIANNGTIMKPYLIESIDLNNKNLYSKKIEQLAQPIALTTATTIKEYMQYSALQNYGLPLNVGIKSGTAELGTGFNHIYLAGFTPKYTIVVSKNKVTGTSTQLIEDFKKIINFLGE